ncbi:iron complex transport system substrate-binding protein [Mesorhizobium albiziae]|uniref:Iron complex transport system substrate-binding protein n=1 Tax=Neomesorhizobium albiziae TaxID=335020 RepID=A0A1I4AI98_9HYPH|nr:siderophore ABC transporter substrate-binding protein [Mesorhizobium albiziae]GLS32881.1 iron ABC transporter substrate-binding protein [Mesorhizobium albiziae]SFK55983.1 iron complex transport system substrate-binding protein [Mesorhizobium albiziae]
MRHFRLWAGLMGVLAVVGTAAAAEITTATGPVTIDKVPAKVAVFDIAAIDTLDRLGVKPDGIPQKLYLGELADVAQGAAVVGDIFEPDLEALNALAPDLIIVGGRSSTKAEATSRVAPTIDMTMDGDDLLAQAKQRLAAYGQIFGKTEQATAIEKELDASVAAARQAVKGKGKALIVMTNGPKISAYGPGSRFGWIHKALELEAAVGEVDTATHGEAISFEFISKANPDWLIVLDRAAAIGSGEQGAKATLDNELVAQTTAAKKGQVIYLPSADFYIAAGGVQATQRVLAIIESAFEKAQ